MTTATDGQPFMDAEMSAEEMRKALYDKLHNRGLINSLKVEHAAQYSSYLSIILRC